MATRTLTVDGISVQVEDRDAQIIQKALDTAAQKLKDAEGKAAKSDEDKEDFKKKFEKDSADSKALIATKDGEIVALKQQLKDAEMTPAKIDALVTDRAQTIAKAKLVIGDSFKADGKTVAEVRRMVVAAKLGDEVVKGMTEDGVNGAFSAYTSNIKNDAGGRNPINDAVNTFSANHTTNDAKEQAYVDYDKQQADAWRTPAARQ